MEYAILISIKKKIALLLMRNSYSTFQVTCQNKQLATDFDQYYKIAKNNTEELQLKYINRPCQIDLKNASSIFAVKCG